MLNSDEEGGDVFFDSLDYVGNCDSVLSEESVSGNRQLLFGRSKYEVWRNEPESIKERRGRFLQEMGFLEYGCSEEFDKDVIVGSSAEILGLERITECSGAHQSSWVSCSKKLEEGFASNREEIDGRTRFMVEVEQVGSERLTTAHEGETSIGLSPSFQQHIEKEFLANGEGSDGHFNLTKKKLKSWWKSLSFVNKRDEGIGISKSEIPVTNSKSTNRCKMKVRQNRKKCMEFTALYLGQEIQAHKGFIWTMKFSPDGQYLASGGKDGVVRVWRVTSSNASCNYLSTEATSKYFHKLKEGKFILRRKPADLASVVVPEKLFKIEDSPLQEFHGHSSDILDLSWSKSNYLLSSSKDKTVRLWQVGCNDCLNVFHHRNYVTCIQFNPLDDGYFISGSIDGKVRIWEIYERRVVDWADVRDIVTAVCYQPDGQGFVVGSITGSCRFYSASGNYLQLDAQIRIQGRKKTSDNRITGIQFCHEKSQRVMITSADSKLRIFNGVDVIHKYRGLRKCGSQLSASFTSTGRHIISVGEDSCVYVWNYDDLSAPSSKHAKSVRSCEYFHFKGVSVAVPWSRMVKQEGLGSDHLQHSLQPPEDMETATLLRDSERFSLGGWFSLDCPSRGSATWPEEKLPLFALPVSGHDNHCHHHDQKQQQDHHHNQIAPSATWGLVIVTAGWDGIIRTFHNYGLPVRL